MQAAEPCPTPDDDTLRRLFAPLEDAVGVGLAVSGGADSLALAWLAQRWSRLVGAPRRLLVLTVDHGLREASAGEAAGVARVASALGFGCRVLRWEGPHPAADVEAAARDARYRLLVNAARVEGLSHLVTAHHRDDQAETLLLRLGRGSGVYGLAGMARSTVRDGIAVVRPLLELPHDDLVAISRAAGLEPIDDPHNRDDRFARARMRALMPALAREGMTAERLVATAGRLRRAAAAIDHYVGRLFDNSVQVDAFGAVRLDAAALAGEPEEVRLRALARILRAVGGAEHVARLESLGALERTIRTAAAGALSPRTLSGVIIAGAKGELRFERELGRAGLPSIEIQDGFDGVWDRRFHLRIAARDGAVTLGALGPAGRMQLPEALRTGAPHALEALPGIWSAGMLLAVPALGFSAAPTGSLDVEGRSLVTERLAAGVEEEES